jgi:hypothetical protein
LRYHLRTLEESYWLLAFPFDLAQGVARNALRQDLSQS